MGFSRPAAVFVAVLTLSACGGGGGSSGGSSSGSSVTASPASGSSLFTSDPIVFVFDRSMNPSSLTLSGTMAADSDTGTWSTTSNSNDTLTLNGNPAWDASQPGTLTVNATDTDGETESLTVGYRVLLKLISFQAADNVIGQPDFVSTDAHQGGTPDANTVNDVYGLLYAGSRLYLAEYNSNRILGFNAIPETDNASADFVIGQPDFTTTDAGTSASGLDGPEGLASDGTRLVVAEWDNQRITLFDPLPDTGPATASVVLGQTAFAPPLASAACTASALDGLEAVTIAGGKVIASVYRQNRILIWNSVPTSSGTPADVVVGQNSFTNCTANDSDQNGIVDSPTSQTISEPEGVWSDGVRLIVADAGNNRVLIWNTFPTTNFAPADVVIGQGSFTRGAINDDDQDGSEDATPSARTLSFPYFIHSNGTQLAVADANNSRVLIWNAIPTSNFEPADVVLGQSDFVHSTENDEDQDDVAGPVGFRTFSSPTAVLIARNKLLAADVANSRVLVFSGQ